MPKMQMAAFFGKSLLSPLLHNLDSHVMDRRQLISSMFDISLPTDHPAMSRLATELPSGYGP